MIRPTTASALCDAFSSGYEAGILDGIRIGRAQAEAEEWPVWQQFIDHVRAAYSITGPLGYQQREQWIQDGRRANSERPDATGEELRDQARKSWE
jgi:hypothetical protein